MTIRRQYSLPNCTLVLDGLSDGNSASGIPDSRPVMSSLFNAECHFVGREQPLLGGREFLTSLVSTVSNYAQEFLSGIHHPVPPTPATDSLVSLTKGDRENTHYLQAKLDPSINPNADGTAEVKLSTIQLFDLLEAIDQFLADRRTLPDLTIPLRPVTKAIAQPISAQATPIGLGLASLVVASLIGYALPAPKVSKPQLGTPAPIVAPSPTKPSGTPPVPAATPANTQPTPQPAATTTPSPTSAIPAKTGQIVEATQLGFLERKLRRDLDLNWQNRARISQPLAVNVGVDRDGRLVDYEPIGQVDKATLSLTPLSKITTPSPAPEQAIGKFKVVFNSNGSLAIEPVATSQGTMTLGKQIADPKLTTTLAQQLQTQLQQSTITRKANYSQNLNYRVAVTKAGVIADYEPQDSVATANQAKTPLPQSVKFDPQAATSQAPLAQYNVAFLPNGKVQVSPRQ
jgi:hypothetical protein